MHLWGHGLFSLQMGKQTGGGGGEANDGDPVPSSTPPECHARLSGSRGNAVVLLVTNDSAVTGVPCYFPGLMTCQQCDFALQQKKMFLTDENHSQSCV